MTELLIWSEFCNSMNTHMQELRFSKLCCWRSKYPVTSETVTPGVFKDHSVFIFRAKQSVLLNLLDPQDEGSLNLERKNYSTNSKVSHSRRLHSSATPLWEHQNLKATSLVLQPHACKYHSLNLVSDVINMTWCIFCMPTTELTANYRIFMEPPMAFL